MAVQFFRVFLIILGLILAPFTLAAQEETTEADIFSNLSGFYFLLGDHKGEETPNELEHPVAQLAYGVGMTFMYNQNVSIDVELLGLTKEYNTPGTVSGGPFTVVDDDMTLDTLGFTVNARIAESFGKLETYLGMGMGMYISKLVLTGSTFGLPGTYEDKSSDMGFEILAGIGYRLPESSINFEYRQLNLQGNFSSVTATNENDIGGKLILLVYRLNI